MKDIGVRCTEVWAVGLSLCRSSVDCDALQRNVEVVAEGIAQYIYNLSTLGHQFQGRLFSGEMVWQTGCGV